MLATNNPTRTAIGFRKLGATGGAETGATRMGGKIGSGDSISSARCGLPHLWQNREPGWSSAPQVQMSAILILVSRRRAARVNRSGGEVHWLFTAFG